jgi:transglutaminase-like putative cysteine protease
METGDRDLAAYLRPTYYLDADAPAVRAFAEEATQGAADDAARASRLFAAVRDRLRYDPYSADFVPEHYRASYTLGRVSAFCVPKAILFAAAARALGIPSRLAFADVKNHLAPPRLLAIMGTDVFVFHGFAELRIEGCWVKASPTFDRALCERLGVAPLEFDGRTDALLQQFDRAGKRYMEYVRDRGRFADFPLKAMVAAWREHYPRLFIDADDADEIAGDEADGEGAEDEQP